MAKPRRGIVEPRGKLGFWRALSGLVGELLITLGSFLVLFVVWQLFWTDVVADADMDQVVTSLEKDYSSDRVHPKAVEMGDAFAIVRIPRFGAKFARPLYEGTTRDILMRGIGHYPDTVMPGEIGNFSMAGHRTTYGKPFNRIAELEVGDVIIIETADTYFVYRVRNWEIVLPTQVSVVLPVPNQPEVAASEALLTMTSCHPQFSSRQRWVTHAVLDTSYPRSEGLPKDLLTVGKK